MSTLNRRTRHARAAKQSVQPGSRLIMNPVFYDIEASGLQNGFPIEIGWAHVELQSLAVVSQGHLINPAPEWDVSTRWDRRAQKLHGITRKLLIDQGEPADSVAARMNASLAGRQLFADSPFDEAWLTELFEVTPLTWRFEVRRTLPRVLAQQFARQRGLASNIVDEALEFAEAQCPRTHRAERDACYWADRVAPADT